MYKCAVHTQKYSIFFYMHFHISDFSNLSRYEAVICDRMHFLCTRLTERAGEQCIPDEHWNAKLNWLAEVTVMKSKIPLPPDNCADLFEMQPLAMRLLRNYWYPGMKP